MVRISTRYRHRSFKKILVTILVALCSLLAASLSTSSPGAASPRAKAEIVRVVDGDTIVVRFESGKTEHVRLIGIDTPESKPNRRATLQATRSYKDEAQIIELGKQAFHNTEALAPPGTAVELEYDVQPRDKYRRLLAYVYLPDGRMLNEAILSSGYANLLTIPPDVRYTQRFQHTYEESRAARRGLWATTEGW